MSSVRRVAHPRAPTLIEQQVGAAAHRLRAAGGSAVDVAQRDHLGRRHDGLQSAAAQPVEGERGRFLLETGIEGGNAPDTCPRFGLDDVAEDDVADVGRLQAGPFDDRARMTCAPSRVGGTSLRLPPKSPIAVRAPATITTSRVALMQTPQLVGKDVPSTPVRPACHPERSSRDRRNRERSGDPSTTLG